MTAAAAFSNSPVAVPLRLPTVGGRVGGRSGSSSTALSVEPLEPLLSIIAPNCAEQIGSCMYAAGFFKVLVLQVKSSTKLGTRSRDVAVAKTSRVVEADLRTI